MVISDSPVLPVKCQQPGEASKVKPLKIILKRSGQRGPKSEVETVDCLLLGLFGCNDT